MGSNWIYRPRDVLDANCPTRLDGVSAEREEAKRLAYTALLQDVGEAMKIPIPAVATATVLCHRFYAAQSMRTYDTWVMATACLFLACKVQEAPKALKDVLLCMWTMKNRGRVAELERIKDREWQDAVRAAVLKGERALLYTICFDFRMAHPYQPALNYIKDLKLAGDDPEHPENPDLMQTAWDMVNLSLRTTLSLQCKPETIAAAAVFLAMKLHKMPTKKIGGKPWYLHHKCNAQPNVMDVAVTQLLEVAQKLRRFVAVRAAPKELVSLLQQKHGGSLVVSAAGQQKDGAAVEQQQHVADAAATADAAERRQDGFGAVAPAVPPTDGVTAMQTD